jgi:hypothetical protein
MRNRSQLGFALLLVLACSLAALAREQTLDELKAKLSSAKVSDQPKLCLEIARRQLDAAEKSYQGGQIPEGQELVKDAVDYAQKAGDAARESRKHIKKTEIEVRKMSRRLQDLKPTLDVDSRQPVQDAINRLEHIRTELLMQMFSER